MKIQVDAKKIPGDGSPRLVFTGPIWNEWDLQFCIHGEKLRWQCDWCEEHFKKKKAKKSR